MLGDRNVSLASNAASIGGRQDGRISARYLQKSDDSLRYTGRPRELEESMVVMPPSMSLPHPPSSHLPSTTPESNMASPTNPANTPSDASLSHFISPQLNDLNNSNKHGLIYSLRNIVPLSSLSSIFLGANSLPRGPPVLQHVFALLVLVLSLFDLGLSVALSVEFWCIWGSVTTCDSHWAFWVPIFVYPGAIVAAPVTG